MQQHRIISLLSILVMLFIPVIGWFLIAQPQLAAAASADQQRAEAAAQVAASEAIVAQLKADSAKLPELRDELDELRGSVPAGVDPSGWIDGLSALATVSKVQISALTVADPLAYVPATPPAGAVAPAEEASGEEGEDADADTTPAPAADFPGIVTSPLVNAANFVAIPVTVEVKGAPSAILRFVNGLQTDNRLYLVSSFTTEPTAEEGGDLVGKIGGFIWAIPTGEPGNPRPVSTVVKQMDPKEPETPATPDPGATGTPTPNPSETTAP